MTTTADALESFFEHATDPVVLRGFVQILAAVFLAFLVLGVIYVRDLGFEREVVRTAVQGLVQITAAGAVIGMLLVAHIAWAAVALSVMLCVAAWISHERGAAIPGVFRTSVVSIGFGAGLVIATMTLAGVIDATMRDMIVIGGMIIANAMQTNSLLLDRFTGELVENRSRIEAALSVGAAPERAIREHVSTSIYASLIPVLDSIRSLGIVKIPGLMAGMIIAGENPIYAAQYQFAVMLMLFGASGLTVVANTILVTRNVFTDAKQLDDAVLDAIES
ncbi:ABC transporter permease [Halopiger goleimassiliensis]|uniref:ABC transporter permease n=1 Tax=Halopiger goleimassiliensis TaxID=1293048 RepID=UPI000677829B|nr:ABC transporter permease [Halopiger goleimassiliensis]